MQKRKLGKSNLEVSAIGLGCMNFKAGGLGNLGQEQIAWLEKDVKGLSASTRPKRSSCPP